MKKLIIFLFCSILLVGTGCKKGFLDEEIRGKVTGVNVLTTQTGLESALTGAYYFDIAPGSEGAGWGPPFLHSEGACVTMGGDDMTCLPGGNKGDFKEFDTFTTTSGNTRALKFYTGCYKAINGANNVINNYQTTVGDPATIRIIAGEAYFLRAIAYYWLVRIYGAIPLLTSAEFSLDLLNIEKSDPKEIYELIEADLLQSEQMLSNTKRDVGRPNIGSAKAFLADVYLTEGGWPIKDASKYALAAAKAKEVIDNHSTYGFQLLPTFAAVFENDPAKNGTAEDVFDITANKDGGQGNSATTLAVMPGDVDGWDEFFAEINFFIDFPDGPRKDATYGVIFTKDDGTVLTWQQLVAGHPYWKKFFVKPGDPQAKMYSSSLPFVMMRYAYVLTIYAEAKARSGEPDELAYTCINDIRTRAGLTPLSGLSAADFATAVVQERGWEFAGERVRWFDLVRLEMVEEAMSHRDPAENEILHSITKKDYLAPIPIVDFLINSNLN